MTGRDKHRFDEFFQRRRWKKEYWSEYHATMHRCGSYDDGYYCTLTTEEHLALWKRNHRQTSIFTRKNWDDLNVDKSANCISGGHKKCKGKMRNLGEGPKRIPCGCECHQK
jgi:hypothetical protein